MGRANAVTKFLKRFDPMLFCERREGKLCVLRKDQRIESYVVDGNLIHFVRPAPYLILALTNDWNLNGEPCDWGLEPILARIQACDLWKRDIASESLKSIEGSRASRDRAADNHIEGFLKENRREFARLTNDINTSTLNTNMKTGD